MTDPRTWVSPGSAVPENRAEPVSETPPEVPAESAPGAGPRTPSEAAPGTEVSGEKTRLSSSRRSPRPGAPGAAARDAIESEIPLRPLGVSEILDGAITYIRRNPRASLGMSAILTSVIQVVITLAQYLVIGAQARTEVTPAMLQRSVGGALITFAGGLGLTAFVVLLLAGLLSPVMARALLGRTTSFEQAWRDARPRLPRLLGTAATIMVVLLLAAAIPLLPPVAAIALGAPIGVIVLAWVIAVPAALVLLVTAYVWFALSTPILVMERRGVFAALRRSVEIARGGWWRTFGGLLLTLVITIFAEFLVLPMPFAVAQRLLLALHPEPAGWLLLAFVAIGAAGRILAGLLLNPFNAGVIALLYADRRMRREAFDLELQMDEPADPVAAWLPGPLTAAGSGRQPKMPRAPLVRAPAARGTPPPQGPPPAQGPPPQGPPPPQGSPPPGWRP